MIYGIIPARLESTRLPRKMLLAETGKPLIQHTWEAVRRARSLDAVIVATDSEEIAAAVRGFGGLVEMTGPHHSGTDRCAEVARRLPDAELIVNVQGDEPEIEGGHIDKLTAAMLASEIPEVGTLATKITPAEVALPSCVKVIFGRGNGKAYHFTRSPVTWGERHIGIYAYRPWTLQYLTSLPPTDFEKTERLEQIRALDSGTWIHVVEVPRSEPGIDTPEDYRAFVERHQ